MIKNLKWNCSISIKHYFSNWFLFLHSESSWFLFISWILLQLFMQNFLRQRLMLMTTKFVVKNSLMLMFVVWLLNIYYANLIELIMSFVCCSFLKSTFANQFQICHIFNFWWFWFWQYNCFNWISVSFIELKFFIVLILSCIAFVRFRICAKIFLFKSLFIFVENILFVNAILNVLNWKRNDRSHCFRVVFSNMTWI